MSTGSSNSNEDRVMELADEFVLRRQAGEYPAVSEYCEQYPELASEIQELFPTLIFLEGTKTSGAGSETVAVKKVGEYELVREIGRGGMGIVYEARHETLGRRVAVKLLPTRFSDDKKALARFQREARAISGLHHTNIVPLFDAGVDNSHCYFAMQLISGTSLDQAVASAKSSLALSNAKDEAQSDGAGSHFSPSEANRRWETLRVMFESADFDTNLHSLSDSRSLFGWVADLGAQIAEALDYAHSQKIIHRDVKPSNILIDQDRNAWLSDFGLAKLEGEDLTQTGDIVGTLRYMSPERFRGHCDERADIYGLGLTLYEILAMQPAYRGSDRVSLIDQICNSRIHRLRDLNPRLPSDLETIVVKACDPEPDARYQTAADLASDLRNFIADRPIKARRANAFESAWRWSRRNRSLAAAIGLAVASLVLLAIFSTVNSIRERGLRFESETAKNESEERGRQLELQKKELQVRGNELVSQQKELQMQAMALKEQSDTLQRNLYYAQMNLASAAASKPAGAETIKARLESTRPEMIGKDLRGWEWHYLFSLTNQEHLQWQEGGWTWEVDFSPDGTKFVYAINGYGIVIRDSKTGDIIRVLRTNGAHNAVWSPDGKSIASSDYVGKIHIWNAEEFEKKHEIIADKHTGVTDLSWSHDSKQLASTVPRRNEFEVWDATTGQSVRKIKTPGNQCRWLEFNPVENILAIRIDDNDTLLFDSDSGEIVAKLDLPYEPVGGVCWSSDGSQLITSGPIRVWDWKEEKLIKRGPEISRAAIAWRPGHRQIAFPSADGIKIWDIDNELDVRNIYGQPNIESLAWSPNGKSLVSVGLDKSVRIWNTDDRAPLLETFAEGRNDDLDWDASGQFLIGNSAMNFANVWDTENLKLTRRVFADGGDLEPNRIWAIAINKVDGRLAFGGASKNVRVWNRDTDKVHVYEGDVGETKALAWAPDGYLAAICWPPHYNPETGTAGPKNACNLVVWDSKGNLVGAPIATRGGFGMGLDWHPDGSRIATSGTKAAIRIWDSTTLELVKEISMPNPTFENSEIRYSPDGTRIATANKSALFVWDADSGAMLGKLDEIQEDFRTVDWSPDGTMLAAGTHDSTSVWDAEHFRLAIKFDLGVQQVRWAPDGARLGISSGKTMRILDATRGYELEATVPTGELAPVVAISKRPARPAKPEIFRSTVVQSLLSDEWTWSEPIQLSDNVNTEQNEYEPFVSRDGLQLYFNSDRPGGFGGYDLYVCKRETKNDDWGPAINLGAIVNSSANEEGAHLLADGKSLYFNSNRNGDNDLFVSRLSDTSDWSEPTAAPAPINSSSIEGEPTLSGDGLTLVFVSTRSNKFELFVSQRQSVDAPWSPPQNPSWLNKAAWQGGPSIVDDEIGSALVYHSADGPKIASRRLFSDSFLISEPLSNSGKLGSSMSPCLCNDGQTLYFRRLHPETGTYDIWMSNRLKVSLDEN